MPVMPNLMDTGHADIVITGITPVSLHVLLIVVDMQTDQVFCACSPSVNYITQGLLHGNVFLYMFVIAVLYSIKKTN